MVTQVMSYPVPPAPGWSKPAERRSAETAVTHPNRERAEVRATRVAVILLLLASAGLVLLIAVAGWSLLSGALPVQLAFVIFYLLLAFYALRWNRGVLPVASALAVLLAIFALVAGPAWFDRDKAGFAAPDLLNAELLGVLTLLVIPLQMLLIGFAMRGFGQGWNVELEQREPAEAPTRVYPHPA
jgi:presenilin-like A22 family membrane protease